MVHDVRFAKAAPVRALVVPEIVWVQAEVRLLKDATSEESGAAEVRSITFARSYLYVRQGPLQLLLTARYRRIIQLVKSGDDSDSTVRQVTWKREDRQQNTSCVSKRRKDKTSLCCVSDRWGKQVPPSSLTSHEKDVKSGGALPVAYHYFIGTSHL